VSTIATILGYWVIAATAIVVTASAVVLAIWAWERLKRRPWFCDRVAALMLGYRDGRR
jgi:hypothetical protein